MITTPLNGAASSDTSGQRKIGPNAAEQAECRAAFALEYKEILDLANEQDSEGDAHSPDWFENGWPGMMPAQASSPGGSAERVQDFSFGSPTMTGYGGVSGPWSGDKSNDAGLAIGSPVGPMYRTSMSRLLSRDSTAQTPVDPARTNATSPLSEGRLDKSELVSWMDAHALGQSSHHCAMYCRMGMEAAGISTRDRPRSGDAGDYGPFLLRHGAQVVSADAYTPQVGDTVVFDKTEQHPYGHIEIFDGHQWVSDFRQHSFSPYRDASSTPPFTIYRLA